MKIYLNELVGGRNSYLSIMERNIELVRIQVGVI